MISFLRLLSLSLVTFFVLVSPACGENLLDQVPDESALFADESSLVTSANPGEIAVFGDQHSVAFSGRLDSFSTYGVNRQWLAGTGSFASNVLLTYTQADLFLDVRLPKGVKAFADVSLTNLPAAVSTASASTVAFDIKEMFIDFNLDRSIYVRTGKQFIQWGRAYFWNPVDFINREQRNFFNLNAVRSGVYGVRVHAPFGQDHNAYLFIDMTNANNLDDFAFLARADWLMGATEIGSSVWGANQKTFSYGLDFSSPLWGFDGSGELVLSYGSNQNKIVESGSSLVLASTQGQWIPVAVLGLSRQLHWERPNRINLRAELFYNGDGYGDNILLRADKKALLIASGLYRANYLSKLYGAAFVSVSEFPGRSSSLSFNLIQNAIDGSGIAVLGLNQSITDGFQMSPSLALYYGDASSEYLLSGYSLAFIVQALLTF